MSESSVVERVIAAWDGQLPTLRRERCACGGPPIEAVDGDWVAIRERLEAHQQTVAHRTWRLRQ